MSETTAPESHAPQPQASLPQMIRFTWSAGPSMPQGMQDNGGGLIDNHLVMVGGFCGGYEDDWKPGKYPRGFLRKGWALDLTREEQGWFELPDFPGIARQGMCGISVNNDLYLWGGFSYTEPYCFTDGYKLSRREEEWRWQELPPLPWPQGSVGVCSIDSKIYLFSGHDYDAENLYVETDRTGKIERLGARLLMFDTDTPQVGWAELPQCPGTARCMSGVAAVGGKVYAIGGYGIKQAALQKAAKSGRADAYEGSHTNHNVVDSWRFDPVTNTWERLRDMPVSVAGFPQGQLVYDDRYILLPCGFQMETILNPDGTVRPKYGRPSKVDRSGWKMHPFLAADEGRRAGYFNHFWVYDTKTGLYGTATMLPYDDHGPPTYVIGDTVYLFPGETASFYWEGEYFGHHPEFVLKGDIEIPDWECNAG